MIKFKRLLPPTLSTLLLFTPSFRNSINFKLRTYGISPNLVTYIIINEHRSRRKGSQRGRRKCGFLRIPPHREAIHHAFQF
jgi:hypothetical protein